MNGHVTIDILGLALTRSSLPSCREYTFQQMPLHIVPFDAGSGLRSVVTSDRDEAPTRCESRTKASFRLDGLGYFCQEAYQVRLQGNGRYHLPKSLLNKED